MVETNDPASELKPAFEIIGDVLETFITVSDLYEPIDTSFKDNVIFNTNNFVINRYSSRVLSMLYPTLKMTSPMSSIYTKKLLGRPSIWKLPQKNQLQDKSIFPFKFFINKTYFYL